MLHSLPVPARLVAVVLAVAAFLLAGNPAAAQAPNPPTLVKEFRLLADNIKLPLKSIAISKDGKLALSMSTGPAILGLGPQLWNIDTGKPGKKLDVKGNVDSLALSADGKRALFCIEDGNLRLWDTTTGKEVRVFKGNILGGAIGVAFSPDGKYVVTGGSALEEKIRLWDVATGKELATFKGNKRAAPALGFSADGARLATGGWEGDLRLWDMKTRKQLHLCEGHTKLIQSVAFAPDGKHVFSGSADKTLRVWEVATGQEAGKMEDDAGSVNSVAALPDGMHAISGSGGEFDVELLPNGASLKSKLGKTQAVRVWDVKAGKALSSFPDPGQPVLHVAVAAKGQRVITVTYDGTIKVWQTGAGK